VRGGMVGHQRTPRSLDSMYTISYQLVNVRFLCLELDCGSYRKARVYDREKSRGRSEWVGN
jgi:hypothetical protein